MNWQISSFRIGRWATKTTTVWDNAAYTTNSVMSNIQGRSFNSTFSVNELNNEALCLDSKSSNQFGVYELELLDVSGSVASNIETFDPIELPGNFGTSGGRATGLYNIDDMWVIGSPMGGGVWLISLDFL